MSQDAGTTAVNMNMNNMNMDDTASQFQTNFSVQGQTYTSHPDSDAYRNKDLWKPEYETILSDWADKAMCYRWLHFRSHQQFNKYNRWFTIPVIIISTLTGTANFATAWFNTYLAQVAIGSFNIIAGIISTIHHFLNISELNESHKLASLAWDKFYRNIKIELSKNPNDRMSAYLMLKTCKEEYTRLMETSPTIESYIVRRFKRKFEHIESYERVMKPEICDTISPTINIVYRSPPIMSAPTPPTYTPPPYTPQLPYTHVAASKQHVSMSDQVALSPIHENDINTQTRSMRAIIDSFINEYEKIHNTKPASEEIFRNLKDSIDQDTLRELTRASI